MNSMGTTTETPMGTTTRRKIDRPRQPGAPYTVEQAAAELNLAPRTVRKRIADKLLRAYRDGRAVRIAEADLAAYRDGLTGRAPATARAEAVAGPRGTGLAARRHLKTGPGR